MLLFYRERNAEGNAVPLVQASAATTGAGVLCNEDRMTAHRRLLAVVWDEGGGKAGSDEFFRVAAQDLLSEFFGVGFVLFV